MRLVQITIPTGKRDAVLRTLDDEGIDYVVTDETSGREYTGVVTFPLPTEAVEPVLDSLRDEAGIDEDAYTVIVDAETVISRRFDALEARYEADEETDERIAREELRTKAREFTSSGWTFAVMTVISAVIATAGVLLDSAVVVVGANVIIPLMDPAMAASVGTVLRDRKLFARGVKFQLSGLLLVVASAAVFAGVVRFGHFIPPNLAVLKLDQVQQGATANVLSLVVALGAGVAGAVSLITGVSSALVGVAIAVALVPPAATLGVAIAWGDPMLAFDASVLLLVNVLSINLAALVVLWYAGYRPGDWLHHGEARSSMLKRVAALVLAIAVLSVFLGGVAFSSFQRGVFEEEAHTVIEETLSEPAYDDLALLDFEVRYRETILASRPTHVTVTIGRRADEDYPRLASTIANRIQAATGRRVTVQVQFVEIQSSTGTPTANVSALHRNTVGTASRHTRLRDATATSRVSQSPVTPHEPSDYYAPR